jgi:hypothetical protein
VGTVLPDSLIALESSSMGEFLMLKINRIIPSLLIVGALFVVPGCASQQAENTTNAVTDSTSNTVGSVLDAVGSVIMYPFYLVGDLFS